MSESELDSKAEDAEPALVVANNVDISNCDLEQVQLVGAIQPHGALLILKEPELTAFLISESYFYSVFNVD